MRFPIVRRLGTGFLFIFSFYTIHVITLINNRSSLNSIALYNCKYKNRAFSVFLRFSRRGFRYKVLRVQQSQRHGLCPRNTPRPFQNGMLQVERGRGRRPQKLHPVQKDFTNDRAGGQRMWVNCQAPNSLIYTIYIYIRVDWTLFKKGVP